MEELARSARNWTSQRVDLYRKERRHEVCVQIVFGTLGLGADLMGIDRDNVGPQGRQSDSWWRG